MNKKLVIIAGILSIALIILAVFYFSANRSANKNVEDSAITTVPVEEGKIASGFPQDLPIEAGSTTVQNYEAATKDGRKQSTLSTTTSKTLSEAVKVYVDYFTEAGWQMAGTLDEQPDLVRAIFRKDTSLLTIEAKKDIESEENKIDLTLIESRK